MRAYMLFDLFCVHFSHMTNLKGNLYLHSYEYPIALFQNIAFSENRIKIRPLVPEILSILQHNVIYKIQMGAWPKMTSLVSYGNLRRWREMRIDRID